MVLHFKGESTVKDKFYLKNFYGALSIFYKKHFPNKAGLYGVVDGLIAMMISAKSLTGVKQSKSVVNDSDWIYFGKDRGNSFSSSPTGTRLVNPGNPIFIGYGSAGCCRCVPGDHFIDKSSQKKPT